MSKKVFTKIAIVLPICCLMALSAYGACPVTSFSFKTIMQDTAESIEKYAKKVYAKLTETADKKNQEAIQGDEQCKKNPNPIVSIKTDAYDYLFKEIVSSDSAKEKEMQRYVKPTKDYSKALEQVQNEFFIKGPETKLELTDTGKALASATGIDVSKSKGVSALDKLNMIKKRRKYATAVSARSIDVSNNVREKLKKDMESIAAASSYGCSQLRGLNIENRIWLALVKETASLLILDTLLLEAQAVNALVREEESLMTVPEKPTAKTISEEKKS